MSTKHRKRAAEDSVEKLLRPIAPKTKILNLQIRKATMDDFNSIFLIINECREKMRKDGEEQWPNHHPSVETVTKGIVEGQHLVAVVNGEIWGGVLLNHSADEQYKQVNWGISDPNPLIVHRLAVSPSHQGGGVAKKLMVFAEEYAKKEGCKAVRLDTYATNTISNGFYQRLGYKKVGTIRLPQYMPGEYNCYEKEV